MPGKHIWIKAFVPSFVSIKIKKLFVMLKYIKHNLFSCKHVKYGINCPLELSSNLSKLSVIDYYYFPYYKLLIWLCAVIILSQRLSQICANKNIQFTFHTIRLLSKSNIKLFLGISHFRKAKSTRFYIQYLSSLYLCISS